MIYPASSVIRQIQVLYILDCEKYTRERILYSLHYIFNIQLVMKFTV